MNLLIQVDQTRLQEWWYLFMTVLQIYKLSDSTTVLVCSDEFIGRDFIQPELHEVVVF